MVNPFETCTTSELKSYRNILLMGQRMISSDPDFTKRNLSQVEQLLKDRKISFEPNKLLST